MTDSNVIVIVIFGPQKYEESCATLKSECSDERRFTFYQVENGRLISEPRILLFYITAYLQK